MPKRNSEIISYHTTRMPRPDCNVKRYMWAGDWILPNSENKGDDVHWGVTLAEVRLHHQDDEERKILAAQLYWDNVDVDKEVRGGIPVVKNTRISVGQVFAGLASDQRLSEVAEDWDLEFSMLTNIVDAIAIFFDLPQNYAYISIGRMHRQQED